MNSDKTKYKILAVDDEQRMVRFIQLNLEQDGFQVITAYNGKDALEQVRTQLPDLILLDIMMPDINGFEVLRKIREVSNVPVIMLTAKGEEDDRIQGLELGADDYITKPFSSKELLARIHAVLKRSQAAQTLSKPSKIVCGDIVIDLARRRVIIAGRPIYLTPTEYKLLHELARHCNHVLLHENLLANVWGPEYRGDVDYLRSYIHYLRKKLEPDPTNPRFIISQPGVGYMLVAPENGPEGA